MKTKKKRLAAKSQVRVRLTPLLDEALDRSIAFAARRVFKHRSEPIKDPTDLVNSLVQTVPDEFWRVLGDLGVEVE